MDENFRILGVMFFNVMLLAFQIEGAYPKIDPLYSVGSTRRGSITPSWCKARNSPAFV